MYIYNFVLSIIWWCAAFPVLILVPFSYQTSACGKSVWGPLGRTQKPGVRKR